MYFMWNSENVKKSIGTVMYFVPCSSYGFMDAHLSTCET